MVTKLDPAIHELASGPNYGVLATLLVKTEVHRQKFQNISRDDRVSVVVWDQEKSAGSKLLSVGAVCSSMISTRDPPQGPPSSVEQSRSQGVVAQSPLKEFSVGSAHLDAINAVKRKGIVYRLVYQVRRAGERS